MSRIILLIHGPFSVYAIRSMLKQGEFFEEIRISGYKADEKDWLEFVEAKNLILSDDVANPGPWNVNRQINLVSRGLECIDSDSIIIKLRSDQSVNLKKLIKVIICHQNILQNGSKFLTTNCFTRTDRLYHPSDMLIVASKDLLSNIYKLELCPKTQLDAEISIRRAVDWGEDPNKLYLWPESYLFTRYLLNEKWEINGSPQDSENALEKFVIIVNSFTVRLKWEKKSTRYVFPFTARNYPPFFKGPLENALCATASTPNRRISEILFWRIARLDTALWIRMSLKQSSRSTLINLRMRIIQFVIAWSPPVILRYLFKSRIYRALKKVESILAKRF